MLAAAEGDVRVRMAVDLEFLCVRTEDLLVAVGGAVEHHDHVALADELPAYLDVGRVFRYSRRQTIFNVVLPSAVPVIGTGIRLAFTKAWLTLVVVELVASSEGLGYLIVISSAHLETPTVFQAIGAAALIGIAAPSGRVVIPAVTK